MGGAGPPEGPVSDGVGVAVGPLTHTRTAAGVTVLSTLGGAAVAYSTAVSRTPAPPAPRAAASTSCPTGYMSDRDARLMPVRRRPHPGIAISSSIVARVASGATMGGSGSGCGGGSGSRAWRGPRTSVGARVDFASQFHISPPQVAAPAAPCSCRTRPAPSLRTPRAALDLSICASLCVWCRLQVGVRVWPMAFRNPRTAAVILAVLLCACGAVAGVANRFTTCIAGETGVRLAGLEHRCVSWGGVPAV